MSEPYRLVRTPDYLADLELLSGLPGDSGGARAEEWLAGGLKVRKLALNRAFTLLAPIVGSAAGLSCRVC